MTVLPMLASPVAADSGAVQAVAPDLGFGPALPWLELRRTYNVNAGGGPFGPGWSSWADTRLQAAGGQQSVVHWRGPDGITASARIGDRLPGNGAQVVAGQPPELVFPDDGMRWQFDPGGRPVLLDPGPGERVAFGWEGERLAAMRHERGRVLVFAWAPTPRGDRIVSAETDDGRWAVYSYDDRGRLAAVEAPSGLVRHEWDDADQLTAVVDADGIVSTPRSTGVAPAVPQGAPDVTKKWDERRRLIAVATPSGITRYGYSGTSRVPSHIEDPEGGVTQLEVGLDGLVRRVVDPDGVTVGLTHDAEGRLSEVTDALGHTHRYEWTPAGQLAAETTPLGRRTTYEHDPGGRVITRTLPDGSVERATFSPAGRVLAVVDAEGAITRWGYDHRGDPVEEIGPEGDVTARSWDDGRLAALRTPSGHTWAFSGASVTDPQGGVWHHGPDGLTTPDGRHHPLTVDPEGRLIAAGTPASSGGVARFGYDLAGHLDGYARPDGATSGATYDRCGRLTSVTGFGRGTTRFGYTPGGRVATITDPLGAVTRLGYDACGRLAELLDPCGGQTYWLYDADGDVVEMVEPTGDPTRYAYDACGRLVETTASHGAVTRYGYDRVGRLTSVMDPTGAVVSCSYDLAGRIAAIVDANGGIVTYGYDVDGNLTAQTDPLGATTTYEYDRTGALIAVTDANGLTTSVIAPEPDTDTKPDDVDRTWNADGRLVAETALAGKQTWDYDRAGRVVAHQLTLADGTMLTTRYTRDACGRVIAVDDPDLGPVTIERDLAGRPTDVEARDLVEELLWSDGMLVAQERRVGTTKQVICYSRDPLGRVVETLTDDDRKARYEYDPAGQLTTIELADRMWRFAWDACGRLLHEDTPAGRRRYSYDPAGQLVEVATPTRLARFTWDAHGRRLTEVSAGAFRRFDWDEATGRLVALRSIETTLEVHTDRAGRLAAVDGIPLLWDSSASPSGAHRLVAIGDRRPDLLCGTAALGDLPDLESTVGDPFGLHVEEPVLGPVGLGPRAAPAVEGLLWFGGRVYDPVTRSFLSRAPGQPAGPNPYAFAGNDPVNHIARPAVDLGDRAYDGAADWRRVVVARLARPRRDAEAPAWQAHVRRPVDVTPALLTRALQEQNPFDADAVRALLLALPTPPTPAFTASRTARTPWAAAGGPPGGAA